MFFGRPRDVSSITSNVLFIELSFYNKLIPCRRGQIVTRTILTWPFMTSSTLRDASRLVCLTVLIGVYGCHCGANNTLFVKCTLGLISSSVAAISIIGVKSTMANKVCAQLTTRDVGLGTQVINCCKTICRIVRDFYLSR